VSVAGVGDGGVTGAVPVGVGVGEAVGIGEAVGDGVGVDGRSGTEQEAPLNAILASASGPR
jgi:hypothetical protein